MDKASRYFAEKVIPNADHHNWVTQYDAVTNTNSSDTRDLYTVHLNDDGTTALYYTGA